MSRIPEGELADWDEVVEEFWADYRGTFNIVEIGPDMRWWIEP